MLSRKKNRAPTRHLEKEFVIDIDKDDIKKLGLKDIWRFDIDSENNIYLTGSPSYARLIFKFGRKGNFIRSLNYCTELDHYSPLILGNSRWKEIKQLDSHKIPGFNSDKVKKVRRFFPRLSWSVSKKRIYAGNDERGYEIQVK